jgi:predicted NUDIX family phosphoesterase
MAFKDGLLKENKKRIIPTELVSTVRVENEYSRRMMEACGFIENNEAAAIFRGVISEDGEVFDPVEVKEYYLTKEQYMKGQR